MKTTHLTDEEIQQYALNDTANDARIIGHAYSCEQCKEKIKAYQLLITGIQQQQQPSFDFDLAEMIIAQLPAPAPKAAKENFLLYGFGIAAVVITCFALYYFRKYVAILFESITPVFIYLVITIVITLSVLLIADMYKHYKKKIHTLDLYKG